MAPPPGPREVGGQRRRLDPARGRLPRHARCVDAVEVGKRVEAGLHRPHAQRAAAEPLRRRDQGLQALPVGHAHPPQVAREVALDE